MDLVAKLQDYGSEKYDEGKDKVTFRRSGTERYVIISVYGKEALVDLIQLSRAVRAVSA